MTGRLDGKVGIVTGAASGIGRATAELLATEGARVILADVDRERGPRVAQAIGSERCRFVATDVSSESDVAACVEAAVDAFGGIDWIVNNAAIGGLGGAIEDQTLADYRRGTDVMLAGPFLMIKYAVPHLKRRGGGAIINVASLAGLFGVGQSVIYTAAKHGLVGLSRASAEQLAPFGIRVNVIAPGWIATPMHKRAFPDADEAELHTRLVDAFAGKQPLERAGEPQDIAEAALYLLSDAARFVTGHTLVVDGGLSTISRPLDHAG